MQISKFLGIYIISYYYIVLSVGMLSLGTLGVLGGFDDPQTLRTKDAVWGIFAIFLMLSAGITFFAVSLLRRKGFGKAGIHTICIIQAVTFLVGMVAKQDFQYFLIAMLIGAIWATWYLTTKKAKEWITKTPDSGKQSVIYSSAQLALRMRLRIAIGVNLIFAIIPLSLMKSFNSYLPPQLQEYNAQLLLERANTMTGLNVILGFIIGVPLLSFLVGIFFFKPWAKWGFIISTGIGFIYPGCTSYIVVMPPSLTCLYSISTGATGFIIYMLLFTDVIPKRNLSGNSDK